MERQQTEIAPARVVIVGAGAVGTSFAFRLMVSGLAAEIVLIDVDRERAEGEVMDLNHGASFVPPVRIWAGDYTDCREAAIVVITAGAKQKPGQSRLELVQANYEIYKEIIPAVTRYTREALLLIVTNPVDIMSYVAWRLSGLPSEKVIGSGTVLDTSRFRFLLSRHCGVDPKNVHGYIIGEHGDSEVPIWSLTNIAGMRLTEYCPSCERHCPGEVREEIFANVRDAAYQIIARKGATYYAIALAMQEIVESILRDEHSVLTVSALLQDYLGLDDLYLSIPCVLGSRGVERTFPLKLTEEELASFQKSGAVVREVLHSLGLAASTAPVMV